ncbi:energy transducer TonB [Spongiibacter sp. KMU-158]|uniref:Energy transducer TonB n=1 Tax=Spongiibacter pelagi TaxID=2760804 RepID=A0A927GUR5_9GAMM|nr:energy transducer TonB [Spongiibacter pelagi]MBD2857866.1 energy transducer TonB [Spongiibacter pelagi]
MSDFIEPNPVVMAQAEHKSAESMIAAALLSVCAVTALAAWGLANFATSEPEYRNLSAAYQGQLESSELRLAEDAVIADWRARLDTALSQRDRASQQKEQSVAMQKQALELQEAQAAIAAARQAAQQAEARAQAAELARKRAQQEQQKQQQVAAEIEQPQQQEEAPAAPAVAAAPKLTGEVVPASIDWDTCKKPVYPAASVRLRQQGDVVLSFAITASGEVENASVLESSGTKRLDYAALNALQRCQFNPETVGGVARPASTQLKFAWRLDQ